MLRGVRRTTLAATALLLLLAFAGPPATAHDPETPEGKAEQAEMLRIYEPTWRSGERLAGAPMTCNASAGLTPGLFAAEQRDLLFTAASDSSDELGVAIDQAEAERRIGNADVIGDAQIRYQGQFLEYAGYARGRGFCRRAEADWPPIEQHAALIRRNHAGHDLDQR